MPLSLFLLQGDWRRSARAVLCLIVPILIVLSAAAGHISACEFPVSTASGAQSFPRMLSDGAGGAFVVWRDTRKFVANDLDIYLQHVIPGPMIAPGWPPDGVPVVAAPYEQDGYRIVLDGTGGVIVVWLDMRGDIATLSDIYAQRVLGDGTIAPGWPADGLPLCTMPGPQVNPVIAPDGAGGAFVAWEDYRTGGGTGSIYGDIYATRVMADGTLAPGWVQNGNPVTTAPNLQADPVVLEDGVGGAIVVWAQAGAFGLHALRLDGTGAVSPGWPTEGVILAAGTRPLGAGKQIVSDGEGGAIVAWQDLRNDPFDFSNHDLFAQRVRADGTLVPGWPANGVSVCEAPRLQQHMDMVVDGVGGAVLVWEDYRTNVADVYGQRVTADGAIAPGWAADGNPLAVGPRYQLTPRAGLDGLGGVMLAFAELTTDGSYDLFAQRVMLDGSFPPGWSPTPRGLCVGAGADYNPAAATDGAGGLIVVAEHVTTIVTDLYAMWVPNGPTPTLLALVSAEVTTDRVLLTWHGADRAGLSARVERRAEGEEWDTRATVQADGQGMLRYEDRQVRPGGRYGYRLVYLTDGGETMTAEEWVTVPLPRFALAGAQPNPVVGELVVAFSLDEDTPAHIEVYDLAGRQVLSREVASLGPGTHRVNLGHSKALSPGVYHIALSQLGRRAVARAVIAR